MTKSIIYCWVVRHFPLPALTSLFLPKATVHDAAALEIPVSVSVASQLRDFPLVPCAFRTNNNHDTRNCAPLSRTTFTHLPLQLHISSSVRSNLLRDQGHLVHRTISHGQWHITWPFAFSMNHLRCLIPYWALCNNMEANEMWSLIPSLLTEIQLRHAQITIKKISILCGHQKWNFYYLIHQ